jgi:hypothetical protein
MSQSPTVPQFIGSTISGVNPTITFQDGNVAHTAYMGVGSSNNSPVTNLPEGFIYIQAPATKGVMFFSGTNTILYLDYQGGTSYYNCAIAPDANAFYALGTPTRYWRDLYLDRDFYWLDIPTVNPGPGRIWSNGGVLTVGS